MYSIPLIKPYITESIKNRVMGVLDSGQLTEGSVTHELEQTIAKYIGAKQAIAVTSCTTGLELALRALNIGEGDEVIVPDYTYPATATAVALVGATPIIIDVNKQNMLMNCTHVKKAITSKTRALIPVSIFGNPLNYTWINELKQKHNLAIIEDAACSLGAMWQNQKVGTFADISVFSLHPRKFITSGEGGVITTNNDALASWMRSFKHFGMDTVHSHREGVHFVRTGTNLKLCNLQAAVALGQMQDIDLLMDKRQKLAHTYKELLHEVPGINMPQITPDGLHSWQTFCVFIKNRNDILQRMRQKGIEVQIGTYSLHKHDAFQKAPYKVEKYLEGSTYCFEMALALPMYHEMTEKEQQHVVSVLKNEVSL